MVAPQNDDQKTGVEIVRKALSAPVPGRLQRSALPKSLFF
jgi:hypothetical protein